MTSAALAQFINGLASTATETFPQSANQPFNFLNLDLYPQDTWKVTKTLTWTFGIRDTLNSNPLNPHQQIARLRGSFNSISHDVNQPLNAAIQTGLGHVFSSTPLAILQPRMAIAWQVGPKTVLRTGFGIFSDILPGSVADLVGVNPPYVQALQGGALGTVGGSAIAPGVPGKNELFTRARALLHLNTIPERFGLVLVEANAAGVPVIAMDLGSCREVIKDGQTGFLVDNVTEAVRALGRISEIDRRACRSRVRQYFSIDTMVEGYERVYSTIFDLEAKRRP